MTSDIYRGLVLALGSESVSAAQATLSNMLSSDPEHAASLATEWLPFIAELPDGEGQRVAIDLVGPYADQSATILDFVLAVTSASHASSRISALNAFIRVPDDSRVTAKLVELLADRDTNVRNAAIGHAGRVVNSISEPVPAGALRVLPDTTQQELALALLDELERAVKRLEDISGGLDDGQRRIIDEVILPAIAELRRLFSESVQTSEELRSKRLLSIFSLGNVMGAAKGLALATTTVANADEATATVIGAVHNLEPVFHLITGIAP